MGSTSPAPSDGLCPQGGWCDGKNFYRCEPGTYNQYNGSVDASACTMCPPGMFSTNPSKSLPGGDSPIKKLIQII